MLATMTVFIIRNSIRTRQFSKPWLPLPNYLILRTYKDIAVGDIPDVSPSIIKKALKYHNVAFTDGHTAFVTTCPVCESKPISSIAGHTKPSHQNLYINKTTGLLICSRCKASGQWSSYDTYLNKKIKNCKRNDLKLLEMLSEKDAIQCYIKRIHDSTVDVHSLSEDTFSSVLNNFKLPQFCSKTADVAKLRIDKSCDNLYFPISDAEMETVGYKVFNVASNSYKIDGPRNYSGIHFGKIRSRESAVVVSNIYDFLILLDAKVPLNVICLPNGLANLSQYTLPSLERFNKLVLWFGNDIESWDCARNFAKKLGEKRCLFIRPTETQQLPHLAPDQDFKSIINSAQPIWHKSITTFSTLREDVLSNLQNIDKVEGVKWKRFPGLNKILKGHRKGELTVITGPTGSGKTTFISEYSLDLAIQGVNTLWGSFEIQNSRLAQIMLQQFSGIPMDENLSQFDFWADQFEKLPIYFMTFHGQQTIKVVMEAIEHATYVHDICHVIIDNLQFMMGMSEDVKYDRYWKQDVIVAAFRNFATKMNCHVTLVIHPRKEKDTEDLTTSSIFGGAKASQEADNVLIIQDKRLTSLRGKKYLQVAKNRYSGDLGVMALDFDKNGLSYAPKKKKVPDKSGDDINNKTVENKCI